ncbi:glycosyl hydrolase family 43 protein [Boeremia exigua]|uniref:glycosyl hydrolase family 43 protein n=1 Tax=Boeremia exigua TaxID=749465 RepID=UPI001E8D2588|nr:glycosyl hydrolase family 43 protein [Boeremia exigua]KAH6642817.1 glycosyl hydrolase family 43 protein [Boeremia exigua]
MLHLLASAALALTVVAQRQPTTIKSQGNPILADGSYFSADPGPLVVNNTLYILAGHDAAPQNDNSFIINEWEMFVSKTTPDPKGSDWDFYPGLIKPNDVFKWAAQGTAYASQIVEGPDGKFYLYAPVTQAQSNNADKFAIGVAVADNPLGPFKDAHPAGPILSQSVPAPGNNIQNIDPTILVDDDGKVYVYYGTFGALRGYQFKSDMVTPVGSVTTVSSLTGFFEAPWIMKRNTTYYMLYAANNAGPNSPCTPTSYHACIAYGTASSPLGPWTFRGVILDIVSSTTSHPGAVEFGDKWFLVYHTADAKTGGNFRRSVAFDVMTFDDAQSPPRINKVVQTRQPAGAPAPTRNIAPRAKASSENATPIQYWIAAVNDGKVPLNPLPPQLWASYAGDSSPQKSTLTLTWSSTVKINGARIAFFADQPAGSNIGVPPPASWSMEYRIGEGAWTKISATYPTSVSDTPPEVKFNEISATSVRAVLVASGSGGKFGGVGVKEWEVLAPTAS